MFFIRTASDFPIITPTPQANPIATSSISIFIDLEGVVANFTEDAAFALDSMEIPHKELILDPSPVYSLCRSEEVMYDICNGFEFYRNLKVYPWTAVIWEECFRIAKGNVYFLIYNNKWDMEAWGGKAHWIRTHFGQYGYDRLIMVGEKHEAAFLPMINERNIYISLPWRKHFHRWCAMGGTGLAWPELDWRADADSASMEIGKRFIELRKWASKYDPGVAREKRFDRYDLL